MLSLIMVILHRQTPIFASEFSTFCKVTIYINLSIIQRESEDSILDLIISDSPGFFVSSGTLSQPTNNDHCIIYANLNCRKEKPTSFTREIWNFNDIDLDGLNGTLSNADWNDVFDAALFDIDVIYHRFFFYFVKYS